MTELLASNGSSKRGNAAEDITGNTAGGAAGCATGSTTDSTTQPARDVGGANVGGVNVGMFFDIKCVSCTKICVTRVFLLLNTVFYITFAAPASTLPTSLWRQTTAATRRSSGRPPLAASLPLAARWAAPPTAPPCARYGQFL